MKRTLTFLILLLAASPAYAFLGMGNGNPKSVMVVSAIAQDGNTLQIGDMTVKLAGVDAPDIRQTCKHDYTDYECGKDAKTALQKFVQLGHLKCTVVGMDQAGYKTANCMVGNFDVAELMVQAGWAIPVDDAAQQTYAQAYQAAQQNHSGMWQGQFSKPDDWRHGDTFPRDPSQQTQQTADPAPQPAPVADAPPAPDSQPQ